MAAYLPNQLFQVPLAELQPDPAQPRKYMDPVALDEMTASAGQVGIIQPVVCRQDPATGLVYVVAPLFPKNVLVEIDFPSFSAEDRAMVIEAMTSMKDTLEAAITRAVKNRKKPT